MAPTNGSRALVKRLDQESPMRLQTHIWPVHRILLKDSAVKLTLHAHPSMLPELAEASLVKADHALDLNTIPMPLFLITGQSAEKTL